MRLDKTLESITEADLQTLLTDEVAEGKAIEYKQCLPDDTDENKREFLADVSSFANAAGGHLIFGIIEEKGVPVEICGLPGIDPDKGLQRLENLIRDGIEPRILGAQMRAVPLSTQDVVIVIRIPRSWAQPHAVTHKKHWRFYSRNSTGKYPLDVSEVRAAFALSEGLADRVRTFRAERLSKIVAGETPVSLGGDGQIVLHIVPFGAFDPDSRVDIPSLGQDTWTLKPINGSVGGQKYNLDGFLTYEYGHTRPGRSYVQLFRSGIIEAVQTSMLRASEGETRHIASIAYEKELLAVLPAYLSIQEQLGVSPPLFLMLTLLGVLGSVMAVSHKLDPFGDRAYRIDRDALVLPEVIIQSFDVEPGQAMRPVFDSVWNAAGWPRSMNYDDAGTWGKGPNCSS
jgi:hypothetical protein